MTSDHIYANAFNQILEMGPVRLARLHTYFKNFERAWNALPKELSRAGIEEKVSRIVLQRKSHIDPIKEVEAVEKEGIHIVLETDPVYPEPLRHIPHPPYILYVKGVLPQKDAILFAVVGTRKPTTYGREACASLARSLAQAGIIIVSGMAIGIDTIAHEACLKAEGKTVAVLGSGLGMNVVYPYTNRKLAERIVASGSAVISEYPLHLKATPWTFPQRNRIIAGLARGTLVVEARQKSGALITAAHAVEYNRDVFAVPGEIFSEAAYGPNRLLKLGATPVASADDIFYALGLDHLAKAEERQTFLCSPDEEKIISFLAEPKSADDIVRESGFNISHVNRVLTLLEIRGIIKNMGSGVYRKL